MSADTEDDDRHWVTGAWPESVVNRVGLLFTSVVEKMGRGFETSVRMLMYQYVGSLSVRSLMSPPHISQSQDRTY
jgi:hypothetical protein